MNKEELKNYLMPEQDRYRPMHWVPFWIGLLVGVILSLLSFATLAQEPRYPFAVRNGRFASYIPGQGWDDEWTIKVPVDSGGIAGVYQGMSGRISMVHYGNGYRALIMDGVQRGMTLAVLSDIGESVYPCTVYLQERHEAVAWVEGKVLTIEDKGWLRITPQRVTKQ